MPPENEEPVSHGMQPTEARRGHRGDATLLAAAAAVGYTYFGYPLLLTAIGRRRARTSARPATPGGLPTLTVVIPAFNEEAVIAAKIADVRAQDYPADRLDIIVAADGSTDRTREIAVAANVLVLWEEARRGKSAAVNRGMSAARGEFVCLTDANCSLAPGSLRALVVPFANPRIAVVSGAKTVIGEGARGGGEGAYWKLESYIKAQESTFGATMGAPGEVTGVRRSAYRPIPPHVINDDYHLACDALVRGLGVAYAPDAKACEAVSLRIGDELERRTRIAAGTWQTTIEHLALADPRRGLTGLAFVSHRVLRSIVVPVLLPLILVGAAARARHSRLARSLFGIQVALYAAAGAGATLDTPVLSLPFQFALANGATLRGAWRFLRGRQPLKWRRAERSLWESAPPPA